MKNIRLSSGDLVIGLTASGRTPYAIGAVRYAKSIGCCTGAVSCNGNAEISKCVDIAVELKTGPEIIAGSTRLKAGTAEKMVLNMISSVSMIQNGKTYKNFMVDMKSTNFKLEKRTVNIVMKAAECSEETAVQMLEAAHHDAKTAIVMIKASVSREEAKALLEAAGGRAGKALQLVNQEISQ